MTDLAFIDSLRGLCALYVAACHAYLMYGESALRTDVDGLPRNLALATAWLGFGRLAVAVFIVISGYCLMLPVVRSEHRRLGNTWIEFMRRRARRILPPYYGALSISVLLIAMMPGLADPAIGEWHKSFPALTPGAVVSHLALVHNYVPSWQYAIDHPMWSIATEWQIYLSFPALVWIWSRFGARRLILAALAVTAVLGYALALFSPDHNPWPPQFVLLFALGMAGAAYCHPDESAKSPAGRLWMSWGRLSMLLFALGAAAILPLWGLRQQVPDLLIGAATVSALIFLFQARQCGAGRRILTLLELRPLVSLGHFSYSLYLLHAPVLAIVFLQARALKLGPVALQIFTLCVGIPVAIASSYLFYLIFERPFLTRATPSVKLRSTVSTNSAIAYVRP